MEIKYKLKEVNEYVNYIKSTLRDLIDDLETTIFKSDAVSLVEIRQYCNDIINYCDQLYFHTKNYFVTVTYKHNVNIDKIKGIDGVIDAIDNDYGEITVSTKECLKYQVLSKLKELGEMEYHDETI